MKFSSTILLVGLNTSNAFITHQSVRTNNVSLQAINRKTFLSSSIASAAALLPFAQYSNAEEEISASASELSVVPVERTIQGCQKPINGKATNCIATKNIKQLDTYSPPWTFEISPDEAFARLKGLIKSDPSLEIVETDDEAKYLRVEAKRLTTVDSIEFLVKGDDKVVIFKSEEKEASGISDFGTNRRRVEELRKKSAGVFGMMGDGLTADSYDGGAAGKRNGFGGQLKAFYGLNSGQGYEEVFE